MIAWTPKQLRALAVPEEFSLALPGSRGGGKTTVINGLVLRASLEHPASTWLWYRRLHDAAEKAYEQFIRFLGEEQIPFEGSIANLRVTLPNGSKVLFPYADDMQAYRDLWQGESAVGLVIDEASSNPTPQLCLAFLSNLRHPTIPTRVIVASNPGGAGAAWVKNGIIAPARAVPAEQPFFSQLFGRHFIAVNTTLRDNPFVPAGYVQGLKAAACGVRALEEIAIEGNWDVTVGAFFPIANANRVRLPHYRFSDSWRPIASLDPGSTNPFCYTLGMMAEDRALAPDGRAYERDSIIVIAEAHSADPATEYVRPVRSVTLADIADAIHSLHEKLGITEPQIWCDDASFSNHGTTPIGNQFQQLGLRVTPARKGRRIPGWQIVKTQLAAAHARDREEQIARSEALGLGVLYKNATPEIAAALFVDATCHYTLTALETAVADERNNEDIANTPLDHALDALRMLVQPAIKGVGPLVSTIPVVHGRDIFSPGEAERYVDHRANFGTGVVHIGKDHPLYSEYRGPK